MPLNIEWIHSQNLIDSWSQKKKYSQKIHIPCYTKICSSVAYFQRMSTNLTFSVNLKAGKFKQWIKKKTSAMTKKCEITKNKFSPCLEHW